MENVLCVEEKRNAGSILVTKPGGKRQFRRPKAVCSTLYLPLVFHVCLLAVAVLLSSHHQQQPGRKKRHLQQDKDKLTGRRSSTGHCHKK
jgi:hypothetical protein